METREWRARRKYSIAGNPTLVRIAWLGALTPAIAIGVVTKNAAVGIAAIGWVVCAIVIADNAAGVTRVRVDEQRVSIVRSGRRRHIPRTKIERIAVRVPLGKSEPMFTPAMTGPFAPPALPSDQVAIFLDGDGRALFRIDEKEWETADFVATVDSLDVPVDADATPIPKDKLASTFPGSYRLLERRPDLVLSGQILLTMLMFTILGYAL